MVKLVAMGVVLRTMRYLGFRVVAMYPNGEGATEVCALFFAVNKDQLDDAVRCYTRRPNSMSVYEHD